jgi:hypothetical protein
MRLVRLCIAALAFFYFDVVMLVAGLDLSMHADRLRACVCLSVTDNTPRFVAAAFPPQGYVTIPLCDFAPRPTIQLDPEIDAAVEALVQDSDADADAATQMHDVTDSTVEFAFLH